LSLWRLREELVHLNTDLRARFDSFEEVEEHLIYDNLYSRGMFREYYIYKATQDGQEYPVSQKLEELESLFFQQIEQANPYDLRAVIKELGREWIRNRWKISAIGAFSSLRSMPMCLISLIRTIHQRRKGGQRRLQRLVDNSSVWLPMSRRPASN